MTTPALLTVALATPVMIATRALVTVPPLWLVMPPGKSRTMPPLLAVTSPALTIVPEDPPETNAPPGPLIVPPLWLVTVPPD